MTRDLVRWLPLVLCVVLLGACGARRPTATPAPAAPAGPGALDLSPVDLDAGRAVRVLTGEGSPAAWSALLDACTQADAVIVGENHGHTLGLAFAAALWEDLSARSPGAALALEFFERDEQSRLDDYLSGLSDQAVLAARTGRTRGNYPPGHRVMVERAKALGLPVIAANAPRPYVRLARMRGLDALDTLTPEQRRLVRRPDELLGGRYRADFEKIMSTPGTQGAAGPADEAAARVEGLYRAQQTWDWTMAESVARAIEGGRRPVLLVIGRFHSDFEGGTVQALRRLRPETRTVVVSVVDAESATIREEDRGRGDYVVYVGPSAARR